MFLILQKEFISLWILAHVKSLKKREKKEK